MTEAERLRDHVDQIAALRHWLMRIEGFAIHNGRVTLENVARNLEASLLKIEDEIAASADRLDPPPTRISGQAWIKGLSTPVVRS